MTCSKVMDPSDESHWAQCPECLAAAEALGSVPTLSPERLELMKANALAVVHAEKPPGSWRRGASLVVLAHWAVGLASVALLSRVSVPPGTELWRWVSTAGWLLTSGLGVWAVLTPGGRWLRRGVWGLGVFSGLATVLGGSGLAAAKSGWACTVTESLVAIVPMGLTLLLLRRFASDWRRAALSGLVAGSAGILAVHLHCPNGTSDHLLGFHLLPMLGLMAVAALVRSRLPSRTFAP